MSLGDMRNSGGGALGAHVCADSEWGCGSEGRARRERSSPGGGGKGAGWRGARPHGQRRGAEALRAEPGLQRRVSGRVWGAGRGPALHRLP